MFYGSAPLSNALECSNNKRHLAALNSHEWKWKLQNYTEINVTAAAAAAANGKVDTVNKQQSRKLISQHEKNNNS